MKHFFTYFLCTLFFAATSTLCSSSSSGSERPSLSTASTSLSQSQRRPSPPRGHTSSPSTRGSTIQVGRPSGIDNYEHINTDEAQHIVVTTPLHEYALQVLPQLKKFTNPHQISPAIYKNYELVIAAACNEPENVQKNLLQWMAIGGMVDNAENTAFEWAALNFVIADALLKKSQETLLKSSTPELQHRVIFAQEEKSKAKKILIMLLAHNDGKGLYPKKEFKFYDRKTEKTISISLNIKEIQELVTKYWKNGHDLPPKGKKGSGFGKTDGLTKRESDVLGQQISDYEKRQEAMTARSQPPSRNSGSYTIEPSQK